MKSPRGVFLVLEGLDGAGTTTQARLLSTQLRQWGFPTLMTREPSAGLFGQAARTAIEDAEPMRPEALALAFAADRVHHMFKPDGIEALLAQGTWVISDRYVLSSLAYQSAQGLELSWLKEINRAAPTPDMTIFIDTSISVCLERIKSRGENLEDRFHKRSSLTTTRRAYMHALASGAFLGQLITTNGNQERRVVLNEIISGMAEALHENLGVFTGFRESSFDVEVE